MSLALLCLPTCFFYCIFAQTGSSALGVDARLSSLSLKQKCPGKGDNNVYLRAVHGWPRCGSVVVYVCVRVSRQGTTAMVALAGGEGARGAFVWPFW